MTAIKKIPTRALIKTAEAELRIACKILEWEIGDIWGHVGVRLPENKGIAVQMFRRAEESKKDWLVHFDYGMKKLAGVGNPPRESVIYTEIFKARPDVNAAVHCHASTCVAMSLADTPGLLRARAIRAVRSGCADLSLGRFIFSTKTKAPTWRAPWATPKA